MSPQEDKRKAVHLLMMLFQCYVTWALRENRLKYEGCLLSRYTLQNTVFMLAQCWKANS
mgnify:CR=1 FL=1